MLQDASALKKAVQAKRQDLEGVGRTPVVRSQRIRAKQHHTGAKLSTVVARLDDDFITAVDPCMDMASQGEAADESGWRKLIS